MFATVIVNFDWIVSQINVFITLFDFVVQIDPFGDYNLTLSQAYDRAILIELLETVANDTNIEISVFEYSENMSVPNPAPATGSKPSSQPNSRPTSAKTPASAGSSRPTSAGGGATQLPGGQFYRVFKFEEKQQELNKDEIKELDNLQSFAHVQDLTMEQLIKLAKVRLTFLTLKFFH